MKLIAGIDPGMTTAVAVVDIESDFYQAYSRRGMTFSEVCDYLVSVGEPIIVSVDTTNTPEAVKRVAAAFNARLHFPKRDLYVGEKKRLVEGKAVRNDHERDALASALYAKSSFSAFFEKVDKSLEEKSLSRISASVKELLLKNETGNIEQAVRLLTAEKEHGVRFVPRVIETKKILELRREIDTLQKKNAALSERLERLEKENAHLRQPVRRDENSVARNLRREIASLIGEKKRVQDEYGLFRTLASRYEFVVQPGEDMKNCVVLFREGMSVKEIEKQSPKAIISSKFIDTTIPVIHPDKVKTMKIGRFCVAEKSEIENAVKESFIEWVAQYKELRKNEAKEAQ